MRKLWLATVYEYKRHVLRKGFLIALLSVPLWMLVSMGIGWIMVSIENDSTPIGYVDYSGVLRRRIAASLPADTPYDPVPLLSFPDETAARAALDAGQIRGYYLLPGDYLEGGAVRLVYRREAVRKAAKEQFEAFVRANLVAEYPPPVARRLLEGIQWENVMLEGREVNELSHTLMRTLVPFFSGLFMYTGLLLISGYLMRSVVDEKENRTIEVLVTSLPPGRLMTAKVIGILAVHLTQITVWAGMGLVTFFFFRSTVPDLPALEVDWGLLGRILAVMVPAFIMVSGLMAAVGAMLTDSSEGQQLSGLITLPLMMPFMLLEWLLSNPDSPLCVGLSLFPLSAPLTMLLRLSFGKVPAWQFAASVSILVLSAIGSIWLAGKVLRLGMLRYGRRLRLGEIWQGILRRA